MLPLPTVAVTVLAAAGCGLIGLPIVPRSSGPFARAVVAIGIGSGVVALLIFALGLLHLWSIPLMKAVPVALAAAGVVFAVLCALPVARPKLGITEHLALLLVALILGLSLVPACAPVTEWDGLAYHLEIPRIWLRSGGTQAVPWMHHSNFPLGSEMLFVPAVAWGHPEAAKVLSWVFFILAAAGAGLIAARIWGRRAGVWAAAAVATVPVAIWEASSAYIDLFTATYMALSCACLVNATEAEGKERGRWALCSALLAGMAAGTKTFALVWIGIGLVWLLAAPDRKKRWRLPLQYLAVALAVCCPWYIRSYILTGNPVYPFLYSIFGGKYWGPLGVEMYRQTWSAFGTGRNLVSFLRMPWSLMSDGGKFIDGNFFFGGCGPLLPALLPAACSRWKGQGARLAAACGLYVCIWFLLSQQSRYLIPIIVLGMPLAAAATDRDGLVGKMSRGAVLVSLLASLWLSLLLAMPPLDLARGNESRDSYISGSMNSYWITQWLPRDAKVLLYGETRGFYFEQPYIWADESLSTFVPYDSFKTPEQMLAWFKRQGFTHAVINRRFAPPPEKSRAIDLWHQAAASGLAEREDSSGQSLGVEVWRIR